MKCPRCSEEMRFFKDYERRMEGYRCPGCGAARGIPVVRLEEVAGGDGPG